MFQSRYRRILWFFGRVTLSIIGWDVVLPKLGLGALSRSTRAKRIQSIAERFRGLAIQMGGVMIKVGQFLSARLDVLPSEITDALADLQDEVQPESYETVRAVIETEMNAPLESIFSSFEHTPLASASIGQVHRARLKSGENDETQPTVVVKVQRPNIQEIVETDLAALRVVSGWMNHYPPIRKRANVSSLLEEFSRSLYEEIDYLKEGSNAETFASNFANRDEVIIPSVYWSHTTRRVLTMVEIQGIKITDYAQIEAAGIDRARVATRLLDAYLKQIFEDRFFHADPHPGNLFVLPVDGDSEPLSWKVVFVDFGMTGVVSPNQFNALREILIAVGVRDIPRLMRAYSMMGILLPGADVDMLQKATERVFERFWGKSTTEIVRMGREEAAEFAQEFSSLLYDMPFQIPENLILLGRCASILSGICTGLDPDFNVWAQMMPYARKLIETDKGGSRQNVIVNETLDILRTLVSLPGRADALLQRIEQGRLEIQMPEMKQQMARLDRRMQRLAGAVFFAAFLMGGIQLYLAGAVTLALACAAGGLVTALWTISGR